MSDLLHDAYERAIRYQAQIDQRDAFPSPSALADLAVFDEALPANPQAPEETLALLDDYGSPATVATTGRRYFGFVTGGSLTIAQAANWLATIWDQNGALYVMSPINAKLESVVLAWLSDLFGLPSGTGGAFVTGATMANFTALAAARHLLLKRQGWDVEAQGLFGAPELKVVVGDEAHVTLFKALSMLGLGRDRVIRVPVDEQGRMRADALPDLDSKTLVCIQAGNVNSGAFDPAEAICARANAAGAWVHVDGAFGLWALASREQAALGAGLALADSWITDGHKWLNVPYDSGIVLCKHPEALRAAMSTSANYLVDSGQREPSQYTPELSRRARVIDVWAALRTLGKAGVEDLVSRTCGLARQFADRLRAEGIRVHNEVVLNQVVVSFGTPEQTQAVISAIQADGTLWAGKTIWQGNHAMRISVSSWASTPEDVERSAQRVLEIAQQVKA